MDRADLSARWHAFARRIGVRPEDHGMIFTTLTEGHASFPHTGYNRPERHYHNLDHVQSCLNEFDQVRTQLDQPDAVEAAIWFHDLVYDPSAADNEERSAGWALGLLDHVGGRFGWRVLELINDTTHRQIPATPDGQYLVDIDLAILGQPAAAYDAYDRNIRREYAHVPEADYRAGRAAVLRSFLARPSIFLTQSFRDRYEMAARQNLSRSILALQSGNG